MHLRPGSIVGDYGVVVQFYPQPEKEVLGEGEEGAALPWLSRPQPRVIFPPIDLMSGRRGEDCEGKRFGEWDWDEVSEMG